MTIIRAPISPVPMRRLLRPLALVALLGSGFGTARAQPGREATVRLDTAVIGALDRAARASHTDALLVLHDGAPVIEWSVGPDEPIELMSATKSVVGLAVGRLLTMGLLDSLDQPVHTVYPEWRQGRKRAITVRHLLTHTSGLQDLPSTDPEVYPSPDVVQLALAAELDDTPGRTYRYSNKAVNLLAGLVHRLSGRPLDRFVADELFRPLGIERFVWMHDPAGTPYAMAGLALRARDLARLGTLVLERGTWNGQRLIDPAVVEAMFTPSARLPTYGLLWGLVPDRTRYTLDTARVDALDATRVSPDDLARVRTLGGRTFDSREALEAAVADAFGPTWRATLTTRLGGTAVGLLFRRDVDRIVGAYAEGYLGQSLLVLPESRIVAVRQIRQRPTHVPDTDDFRDFRDRVRALVRD